MCERERDRMEGEGRGRNGIEREKQGEI